MKNAPADSSTLNKPNTLAHPKGLAEYAKRTVFLTQAFLISILTLITVLVVFIGVLCYLVIRLNGSLAGVIQTSRMTKIYEK